MKIIWSPTSQARARDILDYISDDNPEAALLLIDEFEEKVESLKQNPNAGRIIRGLKNPNIRELIVHKYYGIIYEIKSDSIYILTIRHFRRDFDETNF